MSDPLSESIVHEQIYNASVWLLKNALAVVHNANGHSRRLLQFDPNLVRSLCVVSDGHGDRAVRRIESQRASGLRIEDAVLACRAGHGKRRLLRHFERLGGVSLRSRGDLL